MWRKDLADTINAANERLGIDVHWEHRSFKEQGIDKEPTIHIGATANALGRRGIQTERGNINREIIKRNMMLEQAKEMLELAKQELHSARYATYKSTQIKNTAVSVKNEVMEMIARIVLPVFILSAMVVFLLDKIAECKMCLLIYDTSHIIGI